MRRKRNSVNFNLGSSSLLLIFVVMSLVSFAVLSLSTALSDRNMAQKNLDRNIAYYDACNAAQDKLAEIDEAYYEIYNKVDNKDDYARGCAEVMGNLDLTEITSFSGNGSLCSAFVIPVSDYQGLQVVVEPNYPDGGSTDLYAIKSWKLIYTAEPDIDFSVDVIK